MEDTEEETYSERHWIDNQINVVQGVVIDPVQRYFFDMTAYTEREEKEYSDWFNVPYIVTQRYEGDSYLEYVPRMSGFDIESEEAFNTRKRLDFENWCKKHPKGVYYTVRCLDGGAWDRSTWLRDFEDIEKAVIFCKGIKND